MGAVQVIVILLRAFLLPRAALVALWAQHRPAARFGNAGRLGAAS